MSEHAWHHKDAGFNMRRHGVGKRFPWQFYKVGQFFGRHWRGQLWTGIEFLTHGWRPYTVSFTPALECPNHCACCPWTIYRDSNKRNGLQMMTMETYRKMLAHIPMHCVVEWCGFCECFVNPLTPDFIRIAWEERRRLQIATSLVGLTKAGAKKLDGVKFEKVIIHCPDSVNFVTDEDRWINKWLSSLDGINIGLVIFQSLGPISDKIYNAVTQYGMYQTIPGIEGREDSYVRPRNVVGEIRCKSYCKGGSYLFTRPNGDLHYCPNDWDYEAVLGNLAEQPLMEIVRGKPFMDFERAMKSYDDPVLCRRCYYAVTE